MNLIFFLKLGSVVDNRENNAEFHITVYSKEEKLSIR